MEAAGRHKRADRAFVLAAVRENGADLVHADPKLQDDEEVVLAALSNFSLALEWASPRLRGKRSVVEAAVSARETSTDALKFASDELRDDAQLVEAATKKSCALYNLAVAGPSIKRNAALFLRLLEFAPASQECELNGFVTEDLMALASELVGDAAFMSAAVCIDGAAFEYGSEAVRADRAIALQAVLRVGGMLAHVSAPALRGDRPLVLAAAQHAFQPVRAWTWKSVLQSCDAALRADAEIVRAAVGCCGRELEFADARLLGDKSVIMAALASRVAPSLSILDDDSPHFADREVMLLAASKTGEIGRASPAIKDDREIVLAAARVSGFSVGAASERLKADPELKALYQAAVDCERAANGPTLYWPS